MKIVLIDDEAIVLRGISALIKKQAEYELAGTADNGIDGDVIITTKMKHFETENNRIKAQSVRRVKSLNGS